MIHQPSTDPAQCVGSASVSASDKPSAGSASDRPLPTGADALQSASVSASPTHDAPTLIRLAGGHTLAVTDDFTDLLDELDTDDDVPRLYATDIDGSLHFIVKAHVVSISHLAAGGATA